MRVREIVETDLPVLRAMHEASGFAYEFPDLMSGMETTAVVVDDNDRPLMAAAAEKIVQLYLLAGAFPHPASKLYAIRLLHDALRPQLAAKGYRSAEAFLPPEIAKSFGKRLMCSFQWVRNWPSFCVKV